MRAEGGEKWEAKPEGNGCPEDRAFTSLARLVSRFRDVRRTYISSADNTIRRRDKTPSPFIAKSDGRPHRVLAPSRLVTSGTHAFHEHNTRRAIALHVVWHPSVPARGAKSSGVVALSKRKLFSSRIALKKWNCDRRNSRYFNQWIFSLNNGLSDWHANASV